MDATVRPATTDDPADVRRIARDSWHAAYDDLLGADSVESTVDEWYDLDLLRKSVEREDGVFVVAERATDEGDAKDGPPVVGFAQCVRGDGTAAELLRIYVQPDHWGGGVGTAMLDRVEAWASDRGAERLRLVVLADNEVGNAFYEERGYRIAARQESELGGETVAEYVRAKRL